MKSTQSTIVLNGIPLNVPNRVIDRGEFYVSYNNHDISIYGSDTTALVIDGRGGRFFVLNGNHEANLKGLSFSDALTYVIDNADKLNKLSDELPPRGSTIAEILASPDPVMEALKKWKEKQDPSSLWPIGD
jgi:hypothetical protein